MCPNKVQESRFRRWNYVGKSLNADSKIRKWLSNNKTNIS